MKRSLNVFLFVVVLAAVAVGVSFLLLSRGNGAQGRGPMEARPAPVAVAPVEKGSIRLRRTISGTLEPHFEIILAPKVTGQIESIPVDFGDTVSKGQLVAKLDDAEFVQEVLRAEADLAVAEANLAEARSLAEIAQREIARFDSLRDRGFTSASQYESAEADSLARAAELKVAEAQLRRAQAALESARIRSSYTRITVDWSTPGDQRIVAERYAEPGDTIGANEPLLRVVEINPITAVVYVTERDYTLIQLGQSAAFETDAFPGRKFTGVVERISPIFREATRQARVELAIENPDRGLKPGMFVRVSLVLAEKHDVILVPEVALTRRQGVEGVFTVSPDGKTVHWVPVNVGLRDGSRVEILDTTLSGRVVTLGHQLVEDGSTIHIAEEDTTAGAEAAS